MKVFLSSLWFKELLESVSLNVSQARGKYKSVRSVNKIEGYTNPEREFAI